MLDKINDWLNTLIDSSLQTQPNITPVEKPQDMKGEYLGYFDIKKSGTTPAYQKHISYDKDTNTIHVKEISKPSSKATETPA